MPILNKVPLRLLHVEDNAAQVEMTRALLEADGFAPDVRRVDTEAQFREALGERAYDLIVSDCTMPAFSGLAALALARERCPDLPFVFYSGTIGEEAAVESLKRGAMDFVPKARPEKLAPTIRRVLREAEARRRRQGRMLRQQRLESLGMLTAGVAHGLNNMMTSILLAADQLQQGEVAEPQRQTLRMLRDSADHAKDLVREILGFVRGTEDELSLLEIKPLLEEVLRLLKVVFPRSIRIELQLPAELDRVRGNATQLYQVLITLCVNARDAMPNGGWLRLAAANILVEREEVPGARPWTPRPYVVLRVEDDGIGIRPEDLNRVFEPFFSTKAAGKGAGLGLSAAARIVKGHRGFMNVASRLGKGATFEVYLPAISPTEAKPHTMG